MLSDLTWQKYPDTCASCHKNPCICPAPISYIFISYPEELGNEKDLLKTRIEERLHLQVVSFPEFQNVSIPEGIMNRAFQLINTCDAIVVLIGSGFSPSVYAEFLEADYRLEHDNIFVGVKNGQKDAQVLSFIERIKSRYIYDVFNNTDELNNKILSRLRVAINKFKSWEHG